MSQQSTWATEEEQEIIQENLACYPTLYSIIHKEPRLYRVSFDQYKGCIPSKRSDDVAEFSLGGILLHSSLDKTFQKLLEKVEGWLKLYPEYATPKFGKKLLDNFFNFFSELEVYDALRRAGSFPERDIAMTGKTKNLDFKVFPDERDILIEVTTPRMNRNTELMYGEAPHSGFFDQQRGIERKGYTGPPRIWVVILNKIQNQILEAIGGTDIPVILIVNYTYVYPEIIECCQYTSGCISGIVLYRNGTSKFCPPEICALSEKERRFFTRLMGPSLAEKFNKVISKKE